MSVQATESIVRGEPYVPRVLPTATRFGNHHLPESHSQDVNVQTRNLVETLQKVLKSPSRREKINNRYLTGPPPKPVLAPRGDCRIQKARWLSLPTSSLVARPPSQKPLDEKTSPNIIEEYWVNQRERHRRLRILMQLKESDALFLLKEKKVRWETGMWSFGCRRAFERRHINLRCTLTTRFSLFTRVVIEFRSRLGTSSTDNFPCSAPTTVAFASSSH